MTKSEAVEKCARAMVARHSQTSDNWQANLQKVDLAQDIVAALVALELIQLMPVLHLSDDDKKL